jgi:hypothetical protein
VPQLINVQREINENDIMGWAMFHTITNIQGFVNHNQAITQVVTISLDNSEYNNKANRSRDLARNYRYLIQRVRSQIEHVANEIYIENNVDARAQCSRLVQDLITEVNQFLANNIPPR